MSAAVIAGGDAAPVFQAGKAILDPMALAIKSLVMRDLHLSAAC